MREKVTPSMRFSRVVPVAECVSRRPSLGTICTRCHGPSFYPDFTSSDASNVIDTFTGSGGECGDSLVYVVPGKLEQSLIWQKVHDDPPPCDARMPYSGPYLSDTQINRMARWITELTDDDSD